MNRRPLLTTTFSLILLVAATKTVPVLAARQLFHQTATQPATAAVSVPFDLVNKHIVLKIRVNNSRPLAFVFDTGDHYAIINLDRAKELKLKLHGEVQVGGAGASLQTGAFVSGASFTIEGLPRFSQPIDMAIPIGVLASRIGQDFDGIIGAKFIKEFVVEVDYQARVLRLHNKDRFVYAGEGQVVPIRLVHGHPILQAEVTPQGGEPIKGEFVLDLGAGFALILYSPFVSRHRLLNATLKTIKLLGGAGAGGETTGELGRVAELKIGKYKIPDIPTLFSKDTAGAFADPSQSGNIGARVANKFRIFLDYNRNRIILEANSTFAAAYELAQTGMRIVAEGNDYRTFRVSHLLENTPASDAGLMTNDIITAVNGEPASSLTLSRLNELFELEVTYELTVLRSGKPLKIKLTPRRLV